MKNYETVASNIEYLEQEGATVIVLVIDKIPQLIIALEEAHVSKKESIQVVQYLKQVLHMKVGMITGDNKHAALKVAKYLGIDKDMVTYQAYPETKKEMV